MASLEQGAANPSTFLVEFAIERRFLRATQGLNLVTTVGRHASRLCVIPQRLLPHEANLRCPIPHRLPPL